VKLEEIKYLKLSPPQSQEAYQITRGENRLKECLAKKNSLTIITYLEIEVVYVHNDIINILYM
jgi:hypothetical protein